MREVLDKARIMYATMEVVYAQTQRKSQVSLPTTYGYAEVSLEIELVRIVILWKCVTYNIIFAHAQQTSQPSTRQGILKRQYAVSS